MTLGNQCEHGSLRRVCPICERDEEIARLTERLRLRDEHIDALKAEVERLNNMARATMEAHQYQVKADLREAKATAARFMEEAVKYRDERNALLAEHVCPPSMAGGHPCPPGTDDPKGCKKCWEIHWDTYPEEVTK